MSNERIVLLGGSGFLGRSVANRLAKEGLQVLIPTRRRSRAASVLLLPNAEVVEANIHDPATLTALLRGARAVVNLVGILHGRNGSPYGADFAAAHVQLVENLVKACHSAGVTKLVHISALAASSDAPSAYLRSKAAGEAAVRAAGPELAWTILRPSVIFGRDDRFTNLFAGLAAMPILPLANADARFQPVHVEDVAEVIVRSLLSRDAAGQTYELGGPREYTLRELVRYSGELAGHRPRILALSPCLANLQARCMELAPQPLLSRDNLRSMTVPSVIHNGTPLPFGLTPTALEAVAPTYIGRSNPRGRYFPLRTRARRTSD